MHAAPRHSHSAGMVRQHEYVSTPVASLDTRFPQLLLGSGVKMTTCTCQSEVCVCSAVLWQDVMKNMIKGAVEQYGDVQSEQKLESSRVLASTFGMST